VAATLNADGVTPLKSDGQTAAQAYKELQGAIADASQPEPDVCDVYRRRASNDALSLRQLAEERAKENEAKVRDDLRSIGEKQADSLEMVRQKHEISARRVEPVGLVYLLPEEQK